MKVEEYMQQKKLGMILGLIGALIFFTVSYQSSLQETLSKKLEAPIFEIPLIENKEISYTQLADEIKFNLKVPNYDVKIYIIPELTELPYNRKIRFGVRIEDVGLIKLKRPYFYIFLVNDEKSIVATFPPIKKTNVDVTYFGNIEYHKYTEKGWEPWKTQDHYTAFYKDSLPVAINNTNFYFPRSTLLEGYGNYVYPQGQYAYWTDVAHQVKYSFEPKIGAGDWKIFVFVFDEDYIDHVGNKLPEKILESENSNLDMKNTVAVEIMPIRVLGRELKVEDSLIKIDLWDALKFFATLLGALGIYSVIYRTISLKYNKIRAVFDTIRYDKLYFSGVIMIVIAAILFFFLFLFRG